MYIIIHTRDNTICAHFSNHDLRYNYLVGIYTILHTSVCAQGIALFAAVLAKIRTIQHKANMYRRFCMRIEIITRMLMTSRLYVRFIVLKLEGRSPVVSLSDHRSTKPISTRRALIFSYFSTPSPKIISVHLLLSW